MAPITRITDLIPHLQRTGRNKKDLFAWPVKGSWIRYSTEQYVRSSIALHDVFISLGLHPGERVMTIMGNRPDWNFLDMGLMLAGLIHVPVYPTLSIKTLGMIILDAKPVMMIVENPELASELQNFTQEREFPCVIYSMHAAAGIRHYNELLETGLRHYDGSKLPDDSMITPETIATIIYTSGTTGRPKGVMLSHANIVSNFLAVAPIPGFGPSHRAMSFLPLCHIYERTLNYMYQYLGLSIYYGNPIERAVEMLCEVKPHVFCAVPRFLEKAWSKFLDQGYSKPWLPRMLFLSALRLASGYELKGRNNLWYRSRLMMIRWLVFSRMTRRLGGNVEIIVSGSAPLQSRLARGFWAAGIKVLEGYGLTETSPVIAVNRKGIHEHKIGTVGLPLRDVEVRISDEGEILCKGPNVMVGYWQNPELTQETIDDEGWLHTGDIGVWEDGKFLRIIDRKKELIKTSGGKYISPQQIESLFSESPYFDQIMVIGEGRNFPVAIVSPDFKNLQGWCKGNNLQISSPSEMLSKKEIVRLLYLETEKYNRQLGRFEMIKRFLFVTETWDAGTGELSPTLKLRRKMLYDRYQKVIEDLYEGTE